MSATIRGPRRTRPVSRSASVRAQQKTERATPSTTCGDAFHARARECAARWPGGPMCPTRGSTRYPELTRRRGHVAAGEWSARRWCVAQARGARLASGFGRFKRSEAQFSSQKFTTEPIFLSSAPVFAPRMQFSSGFRYRSVEEEDIDPGRSVACRGAIRNVPSTSPL